MKEKAKWVILKKEDEPKEEILETGTVIDYDDLEEEAQKDMTS